MAGYPLRKLVRLTSNNQVVIPIPIARHLKLIKGSYLEVEEKNQKIVMTPKRVVDEEDFAMYEKIVKRGRELFKKGETVDWEEVKKKQEPT
ncbi:MAG: AbrB/MazE/SpoVT family DNA-binding domain-containing protein [Deltaproteobacteria bacterium]|nr:AbrB/MazE/SpoVT family DNA-binding domain-containing protein [Deltaproteobacteria bacterium]